MEVVTRAARANAPATEGCADAGASRKRVRLHYEERGEGAPILCIHGAGSSALVWADAAEKLAGIGRVIAYDRRGCARSERPEPYERTSVTEHADDAAALLDALGATRRSSSAEATEARSRSTSRSAIPTACGPS